jgi:hypothetical protein
MVSAERLTADLVFALTCILSEEVEPPVIWPYERCFAEEFESSGKMNCTAAVGTTVTGGPTIATSTSTGAGVFGSNNWRSHDCYVRADSDYRIRRYGLFWQSYLVISLETWRGARKLLICD